jgi:hypothetical protein
MNHWPNSRAPDRLRGLKDTVQQAYLAENESDAGSPPEGLAKASVSIRHTVPIATVLSPSQCMKSPTQTPV